MEKGNKTISLIAFIALVGNAVILLAELIIGLMKGFNGNILTQITVLLANFVVAWVAYGFIRTKPRGYVITYAVSTVVLAVSSLWPLIKSIVDFVNSFSDKQ